MLITTLVALLLAGADGSVAKELSLAELRQAYAMQQFQPAPHMALAKYYHDQGNRLLAFYILESARQTRFEADVFDEAFGKAFLGIKPVDASKETEAKLLAKFEQDPKDAKTLSHLVDIYVSREDWGNSRSYLKKLIVLKPEEFKHYEALAEAYQRDKDEEKAKAVLEFFFTKYPESVAAFAKNINSTTQSTPDKAKALVEQALKKYPQDPMFLFNQGMLLQNAEKLKEAEPFFVKAAELGKDNAHIQGWVGRYFLRVRGNDARSLQYYLNAYFLNPHFADTEFAEGRIRKLNFKLAAEVFETAEKKEQDMATLVQDDNPMVASLALSKLAKPWDAKNRTLFLRVLGHDDPTLRTQALDVLIKNADDALNKDVQMLLVSDDLRKRGLACYLAVSVWNERGIEVVRPLLADDCPLVRFDAITALWEDGGEKGKQAVRDHTKKEKDPWLTKMLETIEEKKL